MKEPAFLAKLQRAALANPTNSDLYTVEMAEFVDDVRSPRDAVVPAAPVPGGGRRAWASRTRSRPRSTGRCAATSARGCARSAATRCSTSARPSTAGLGYTLSLTNTADPSKYQYFPSSTGRASTIPSYASRSTRPSSSASQRAEAAALGADQERLLASARTTSPASCSSPSRPRAATTTSAPSSCARCASSPHENDALLVCDEVQTGMGLTGKMWVHQHDDVRPDLLAFGKKTQVCGMMAGPRHRRGAGQRVPRLDSRINSTWGGNLADMVRCQRLPRDHRGGAAGRQRRRHGHAPATQVSARWPRSSRRWSRACAARA